MCTHSDPRQSPLARHSAASVPGGHRMSPHTPAVFCFAICCASCASYTNRKKALDDDMSRYICCNGDWPCAGMCTATLDTRKHVRAVVGQLTGLLRCCIHVSCSWPCAQHFNFSHPDSSAARLVNPVIDSVMHATAVHAQGAYSMWHPFDPAAEVRSASHARTWHVLRRSVQLTGALTMRSGCIPIPRLLVRPLPPS